ncbi:DsbA family protein [Schinkia azotoformans]|uniref:DsbA family protein n=1 Tax=Schinkia azotoformans TaxID=1454 RepID=UPI002DB957BD|nr:DsbA family protein [Schinkia azotoformans]MEC1719191.1 DsbA family protein [Schinkia azotoformans]MED4413397.1 DsbA family protein [Schinkia azotoformans]
MNKTKNSPFKLIVILTLVIVATMVALVFANGSTNSTSTTEQTFDKAPSIEGQPILGDPNAPITVVEFGDYMCPACKAWGQDYFPALMDEYINTGKVKFVYVNVMFHGEESILGSLAAESIYKQNPEAYWQFHKELFNSQPTDEHEASWINNDLLLTIANSIPTIDTDKLQNDLVQQSAMKEIEIDKKLVEDYKVEFTPSIMVNETMLEDPFDYERIKTLIEQELDGK